MIDTPTHVTPEPTPPIRRRRRKKGGLKWKTIGAVTAVVASIACISAVVWLLTTRQALRAAVTTEEVTPSAVAPSARAPAFLPRGKQTSDDLIRELGEGDIAAKMGLSFDNRVSKAEKPTGPAYDAKIPNVGLTFTPIAKDAPEVIEALSVLDAYLAATTWHEKLPFVFRSERCEGLMRNYYDRRAESEPQPRAVIGAGLITAGESKIVNLTFACPERAGTGLSANFHRSAAGKLLLDWEAWTGFSEKAWPDIKKERPLIPTLMRATAEETDYYNYEFADRSHWLAVKLRSPDGVHSITGYCERRSGAGIALGNLIGVPVAQNTDLDKPGVIPIRPPGSRSNVTIRISFPSSAQSDHCVKITDLLADRWMLFDGEF